MKHLRLLAPALSLFLTTLVVVQAFDLVPCADEAEAASHDGGFHVHGTVEPGAHPTPAPGADHDEGVPHEESPGLADCLCHVTFTRTEHLPSVSGAPAAPSAAFAHYLAHVESAEPLPIDHVPLA
jgi:hypothetical protein